MGKSSDQLREELDMQRSQTGEKIDDLQQQFQSQVDDTRQQVTDTVSQVRDEAQAMVTDTVDTVKSAVEEFDLTRHIEERPLVTAGMALLGGFVLGALLEGDRNRGGGSNGYSNGSYANQSGQQSGSSSGFSDTLRNAARSSGLEETFSNAGAALMGTVTDQLKQMVDRSFPGFSDKLNTTQQQSGSFTDKAKAAQKDAQSQ